MSHKEKKLRIGRAHPEHPEHAKYVRNLRSTDQLMRQFLKLETGLGNSSAYNRGHVFNFEWTQEQRDVVNKLMEVEGLTFEEAFDAVVGRR